MNRLAATSAGLAAPESTPADRWISRTAAATEAALAGIAGALSYSHMRQLAQDHGQAGWHAHAFPLSVDGIEMVASLVLLADHRAGRRSGWLPWVALAIGTVGSLAANVATAGSGVVSRIVAGWPALALLIAVKLLSSVLDRHGSVYPARSGSDQVGCSAPLAGSVRAKPPADVQGHELKAAPIPGIADLLPAARAARDDLVRNGRPVTRDAVAAWLRENGHPVGNSRLTSLLRALRAEAHGPTPAAS